VSQFSADNLGIPRDERSRCDRRHCRVSGQPDHGLEAAMDMEQRLVDRPGLSTAGEDAAWRSLRERLVIVLRPVGAPTAIGFFGLAAASLPFSGLQLGWVPVDQGRQVALVMIGFAFLAQALAAVFGLLARDGTAATAMATLALSWLVVGWVMNTSPPGTTSRALGLLLIFSGGAMLLIAATAALSKLVPAAVFLVASLRFFATAGYHLGGGQGWQRVAGVIGLVLFALAMYAAWAATLEDAVGRTVLPLGRRGKGKVAVTGSLLEQTKEVVTEPGVREQL
jgi:succinate-acetate transporter protein